MAGYSYNIADSTMEMDKKEGLASSTSQSVAEATTSSSQAGNKSMDEQNERKSGYDLADGNHNF